MADLDVFSDIVATVAGTRASGLKVTDGTVSLMLDVSGMSPAEREHIEADVRGALEKVGAQSVRVMLSASRRA
jgi:ATP-binding protein involved in chromosome partitioning